MEKELWKGNEAIAEAAIRAGCDCFFGYPITPQSEVPEYMSVHLPQAGGVFIQSESELAAINTVYGAAGDGTAIDGIQVYYQTASGEPWQQAYYRSQTTERAGYLPVCCDDGTTYYGYDGWAGLYGEPMDRLQIDIEPACRF